MNKHITYSILSLFLICSAQSFAQDTLQQVFRPRLGLGTGVMTYYGEVQNYQKNFNSTVNRIGGLVYVNAPVSKMFNIELSATYAKIAANERTLKRSYNFESRIRMGTAMLYYNFYPLFQEHRSSFHPFIGVGFSSFEFLSKTDRFDAMGNEYFYWSDGSIMSLAEDDPLASTDAVALTRDYTYETDLRELDEDNLGKYREQSVSIPLSFGVEWHMSPRWDFRIAATYNLAFTDLIDNVSLAGTGIRKGDKKNDRLLFTYVSLSYDLKFGKGDEEEFPDLMDEDGIPLFAEWDPNDFDKDGVIDALDDCPATPIEALVDENGCPLDTDQDGVPDYYDDEPGTKLDSYVNEFGVTLTEEDFIDHARLYYDSTGYEQPFEEFRTEVVMNKQRNKTYPRATQTKSGLKYVIVVGQEQKDVTVNDLHKFLGYNEYSTMVKGDTVYYTLGSFDSIEEAVAAKNSLEDQGVDVADISRNSGNGETLFSIDEEIIEKVERVNLQEGRDGPDYSEPEQVYRVQIGAFRTKVDTEELYPGIDVVYGASDKDNINRYYTGSFKTFEEATEYQKELKKKGYSSTFIVAYEQQKRVTLIEAGVDENNLPNNYSETTELTTFVEDRDTTTNQVVENDEGLDMSKVKYRVQLAYSKEEIPVETVDVLYNIGRIKPVKGKDGSTSYYSQEYDTPEERDKAILEFKKYKLDQLVPIIEYNGEFYTEEEFNKKYR
ncbi:MAG: hypothetical protein ACI8ZM_002132 [Crocinitomix sp.]